MRIIGVIGFVIFAVTGWVGYNKVWSGSQERLRAIDAQIKSETELQRTQVAVAEVLIRIEQYRERLAPSPDPSWLANQVNSIGQQAGLKTFNTDQETPQETSQYTRLAVRLDFPATYHQLGRFLDSLERADALFRVERLDVGRPVKDGDPSAVSMTVSTLYVPPVTVAR